jgi:threonine dehydrogenase-like Zn-dependent dehydrogenase
VKEAVSYETRLFVQKKLDILGSRNPMDEDFRAVIATLQAGKFPTGRAIGKVVPLADAGGVLAQWSEDPKRFCKSLVAVS